MRVLFGASRKVEEGSDGAKVQAKTTVRTIVPDEMPALLASARSVIIVPAYGMAVAQAQYGVSDLAKLPGKRGIDVRYAIRPVAGRMPGHINVLVAKATIPYGQLCDVDQINPHFIQADLALRSERTM
jgi:proton-translocating NAD(P)+ transhydrogenase subunit beta